MKIMNIMIGFTVMWCLLCPTTKAETYLFVGTHFPYIIEETNNGGLQGVGVEIINEIAKSMGHNLQIKVYPWKRAQDLIERGKADVLIGPYKTPEREKFMKFSSDHFYTDRMVFYVKSDSSLVYNGDFMSLQGKKFGITLGWSYGEGFDKVKGAFILDSPVKDLCINFSKLLKNRVEVVPATNRHALVCIEKLDIENKIKLLSPDFQTTKGYFGFSRQRSMNDFYEHFNQRLKEMVENGTVARINKKYQLIY